MDVCGENRESIQCEFILYNCGDHLCLHIFLCSFNIIDLSNVHLLIFKPSCQPYLISWSFDQASNHF